MPENVTRESDEERSERRVRGVAARWHIPPQDALELIHAVEVQQTSSPSRIALRWRITVEEALELQRNVDTQQTALPHTFSLEEVLSA